MDDCELDHACAKALNALLRTFGFDGWVIVCNPATDYPEPGFVFDHWYPKGHAIYRPTREGITEVVNGYITRRQTARTAPARSS